MQGETHFPPAHGKGVQSQSHPCRARGDATLTRTRPPKRFLRRHLGVPDPQTLHVLPADTFWKHDPPLMGNACVPTNQACRVRLPMALFQ